jgi:serpin B
VDERGTEAAAATAVIMKTLSMPAPPRLEVTVDRPFLFAITDTDNGVPLFLGQVTNPAND